MRRADRLFQLIQALRGRRRVVTARRLADLLDVSLRTIYRDVRDLQLSGVPIEGEAGVGYALRGGSDIPPLMFTRDELEALTIGARFVTAFASPALASAAKQATTKIEAVLPDELRQRVERSRVFAPPASKRRDERRVMGELHEAIARRHLVRFAYATPDGKTSERTVEPLCLAFWGYAWTLSAWCRLRGDFRDFRIDRMQQCTTLPDRFDDLPERSLQTYFERVGLAGVVEP